MTEAYRARRAARRKPLLLTGVRQCRKTYAARKFAEVDFLIEREGEVFPIEVRPADNARATPGSGACRSTCCGGSPGISAGIKEAGNPDGLSACSLSGPGHGPSAQGRGFNG